MGYSAIQSYLLLWVPGLVPYSSERGTAGPEDVFSRNSSVGREGYRNIRSDWGTCVDTGNFSGNYNPHHILWRHLPPARVTWEQWEPLGEPCVAVCCPVHSIDLIDRLYSLLQYCMKGPLGVLTRCKGYLDLDTFYTWKSGFQGRGLFGTLIHDIVVKVCSRWKSAKKRKFNCYK